MECTGKGREKRCPSQTTSTKADLGKFRSVYRYSAPLQPSSCRDKNEQGLDVKRLIKASGQLVSVLAYGVLT